MLSEKEFIDVIQRNQKIIYKVCNLYTSNPADKDDLYQEIVFNAWKGIINFKGEAKITTWLYQVALNTAITFIKKEHKQQKIASYAKDWNAENIGEEQNEQLTAMLKAIEELSAIEKAIIMLFFEDYKYRDIGMMLGISENNVGVKISRIKEKLKTITPKYL